MSATQLYRFVKASERLPEDKRNPDGSPIQIITRNVFENGYQQVTATTANQIKDLAKHGIPDHPEWEWLEPIAPLPPQPVPEEVEQRAKEYADNVFAENGGDMGHYTPIDAGMIAEAAYLAGASSVNVDELRQHLEEEKKTNHLLHLAMADAEKRGHDKAMSSKSTPSVDGLVRALEKLKGTVYDMINNGGDADLLAVIVHIDEALAAHQSSGEMGEREALKDEVEGLRKENAMLIERCHRMMDIIEERNATINQISSDLLNLQTKHPKI